MISVKTLSNLFSKCKMVNNTLPCKNLSTLQQPKFSRHVSAMHENVFKKTQANTLLLQRNKAAPSYNLDSVRTNTRYHYYPSAIKRIRKNGLEKRLSSKSQREILFRKIIKGRRTLSTFDRFTNQLLEKRTAKRINLFDRKVGYQKTAKPEYYKF